jgi:glucose-6-phosphate dehydrogenase assembly protein OpcA
VSTAAPVVPTWTWEGRDVSVAQVVDRLAAQRRRTDGPPLTLAGVLNLIAHVPRAAELDAMHEVIASLADHQPSRAVLLLECPDGAGIDAVVRTGCRLSGGNVVVGVEMVTLELHGEGREGDASAIQPLLRSDLPNVLWWPGAPDPDPDGPLARLAPLADRIVTESGRHARGVDAVSALAGWVPGAPGAVTDLAWAAITPWRQLVVQMLGAGGLAPDGDGPVRATIVHPGPCASAEALLLAGWLRDRAGARLDVAMEQREGATPVLGVTVELPAEGRCVAIARMPDRQAAAVTVTGPGDDAPGRPRALPLPGMDRARLLAGELELQRRDAAFERALPHAAEVARR